MPPTGENRLGLMGGTFDPVHYGHLVTAESARAQFQLDKVFFIPSGKPPHKKGKDYLVSEPEQRYLMTFLATASHPFFEVSRMEIDRGGYSYTVETLREFRRVFGSPTKLFFITGADAILEILTWKGVEELLTHCEFIAATRPGYHLEQLAGTLRQLPGEAAQVIHFLEVPSLAISSTDIRQRVEEGRPIKYLLPEAVEEYIRKNRLYLRS